LNGTSSTKLQKGKKRGRLAKFPWGDGGMNGPCLPQGVWLHFLEGEMGHVCPKEFGYISLRENMCSQRYCFIFFYILSLISSLYVIVYNMEGCIMNEMLKNFYHTSL
jgi:hypothetical protein